MVDTRSVYQAALEWLGGDGSADGVFEDAPAPLAV